MVWVTALKPWPPCRPAPYRTNSPSLCLVPRCPSSHRSTPPCAWHSAERWPAQRQHKRLPLRAGKTLPIPWFSATPWSAWPCTIWETPGAGISCRPATASLILGVCSLAPCCAFQRGCCPQAVLRWRSCTAPSRVKHRPAVAWCSLGRNWKKAQCSSPARTLSLRCVWPMVPSCAYRPSPRCSYNNCDAEAGQAAFSRCLRCTAAASRLRFRTRIRRHAILRYVRPPHRPAYVAPALMYA